MSPICETQTLHSHHEEIFSSNPIKEC